MIELLWNSPISEAKMSRCFDALEHNPPGRVLDVGCGCGEVLIRLHERFRMQGLGIDSSAEHIEEASCRAAGRVADSSLRFLQADAATFEFEPDAFDLFVCIGATHAFGLGGNAFGNAIERMIPLVRTEGFLLVTDGYMKQSASPEYREVLGDSMPDELTHAANVATGREMGLIPFAAWTSSDDEWDEFEWGYQRIVERQAFDSPDDTELLAKLARRRDWMQAYLSWGRDTLGFGTYLFKKPSG